MLISYSAICSTSEASRPSRRAYSKKRRRRHTAKRYITELNATWGIRSRASKTIDMILTLSRPMETTTVAEHLTARRSALAQGSHLRARTTRLLDGMILIWKL